MQKATLRKTGKQVLTVVALLVSLIAVQAASAGEVQPQPELLVEKTIQTKSYLEYQWKLEKSVDRPEIVLASDPSTGKATYTLTVARDEGTVVGWEMWGDITITNNTNQTASILHVSDELSDDAVDVPVQCDGPGFPLDLGPGEMLNCSYGPVALPNGDGRINWAKVVTDGQIGVAGSSASVPVLFIDEPTPVNDKIMVVDDYSTPSDERDDIWFEFNDSGTEIYEYTFWCKDAGEHTNTARIVQGQDDQIEPINAVNVPLETGPQDEGLIAQASVAVSCDSRKQHDDDEIDPPTQQLDAPASKLGVPAATVVDLSCLGADARRGSFGDSAWGLIGPKGLKTKFFLSKRSYWKMLRLKDRANPYYKLAATYTMARLHRLTGAPTNRAVTKSMNWAQRYLATHIPAYSKRMNHASANRKRIVKRLQRVMRKHSRVLARYAASADASREDVPVAVDFRGGGLGFGG